MRVDVWSDMVCPFCAIGKKRLEAAAAAEGILMEVTWRSFELDPEAPASSSDSMAAHLAEKYGLSADQARQSLERTKALAAAEGLDFDWDKVRGANTFDAHRLAHFAREQNLGGRMEERLMKAYFSEGALLSDRETLVRLAAEAGMDAEAVRAMLKSGRYGEAVRKEQIMARQMEITGVPFFVFDGRYAVSGAQSTEIFQRALSMAAIPEVTGDACGCGHHHHGAHDHDHDDEEDGGCCGGGGCGGEGECREEGRAHTHPRGR